MTDIIAIYQDETNGVKDAAGIVSSLVFQPITTDMTSHMSRRGGNALGLAGQGPVNRKCHRRGYFSHLITDSDSYQY